MSKSLLQCAVEDSRDAQKKLGRAFAVLGVLIGIGLAGLSAISALFKSFVHWLAQEGPAIQVRMDAMRDVLMNPLGLSLVGIAFVLNVMWLGRSRIIFDAAATKIENGEEFDKDALWAEVRIQQRCWRGMAWASFWYCFILLLTSSDLPPGRSFPLWLLCGVVANGTVAACAHLMGYLLPMLLIRQKLDTAIERSASPPGGPD
jgi:hypothetical protein